MKRDRDFQLYERIRVNFQRRQRQIRWGLFAVRLSRDHQGTIHTRIADRHLWSIPPLLAEKGFVGLEGF